MEQQAHTEAEESSPLFTRLRNSILPLKPGDSTAVKLFKQSGFYVFCVVFVLVTAAIVVAVAIAL